MARPVNPTAEVRPGGRGFPSPEQYRALKVVAFDVDGVLTDGRACIDAGGLETKNFDVRDGSGIAFLHHAGLEVAILSGRKCRAVSVRAHELNIPRARVWQGCRRKLEGYEKLLAACGVHDQEVAFAGDDIVDLPVLERVGLACCPGDARPEAIAACHVVTAGFGGRGCVRQVCEHILKQRGPEVWAAVLRRYLGRAPEEPAP